MKGEGDLGQPMHAARTFQGGPPRSSQRLQQRALIVDGMPSGSIMGVLW